MKTDYFYPSCGAGQIHASCWMPEGEPKAVMQIVHGIGELAERYDEFARYLNSLGYIVVAEDHMGHGESMDTGSVQGYFHGGWFAGVDDTYRLTKDTMAKYPGLPYVLFGHSMGSFMARTILARYPDSSITAAIICGTGWQPREALPLLIGIVEIICKFTGEQNPSILMQKLVFGGYNKRIPNPRTPADWLSRDEKMVDAYIANKRCGFISSCGLLRDMMKGILYVEDPKNLAHMDKALPIFFIAGAEDPVGPYGKGVERTAAEYKKAGMRDVTLKLYPGARHELTNETNRQEVYGDIAAWLAPHITK